MRFFVLIFLAGFVPSSLQAQTLFQNTNQSCESELVLCGTGACVFPNATSLACRHINRDQTFSGADFNGDGFADCVAARPNSFNSKIPEPHVSVLLNQGTLATACTPGPGKQFQAASDYSLSGIGVDTTISNVMAGDLNGGNSDFVIPSIATGNEDMVQAMNPGTGFGPSGSALTTVDVPWDTGTENGFSSFSGARNAALFDCNNDKLLDAAIVVADLTSGSKTKINILMNSGTGLSPLVPTESFDTNIPGAAEGDVGLSIGDFNNDNNLDVAVWVERTSDGTPIEQVATVCTNDGNCNLTCPASPLIDLATAHPGQNAAPSSMEAGDFNGDGNADLVFAEPRLSATDPIPTPEPQGLQYYFGSGSATFSEGSFVPFPGFAKLSLSLDVLTTGCFNNDNVPDVAVTLQDSEFVLNFVGLVTSAAGGAFNPIQGLSGPGRAMRGIDTADFDNAGGDDIMVLAENGKNEQSAFVFMNGLETISAIAGADQTGDPGAALAVTGASCSLSPELATPFSDPARFAEQWTVTSSPAGSTPVLSGANTLTPSLTGDRPGVYTLQLACRTRCTSIVTDNKNITLAGVVPTPSVAPIPTPSVGPVPSVGTQGGCLANLSPMEGGKERDLSLLGMGLGLAGLYLLARRSRKTE